MDDQVRHYYPVSWEQLHRDAKALAWRLAERGPYARIVAITRGGLVPAHIIARELDIRLIDTVCISSYDDQTQREAAVLKSVAGDGEGWLIVDDLVDTGKTACTRYMAVELKFLNVPTVDDCGGRSPAIDAVDQTYTLLVGGTATVSDGVAQDPDGVPSTSTFPFLRDAQ